jgi:UPF0176 protein
VEPLLRNADPDSDVAAVIDTRNDYEVAIGTFAGARPETPSFRDFPPGGRKTSTAFTTKAVAG